MWIREGDLVEVTSGDDAGPADSPTRAKVLKVYSERSKVLVEGINRVYKHVRKSQKNPQGGRLSKEMPISISNVRLVCPKCGKAARVGARFTSEGAKERYCKKCGSGIGEISPPRKRPAKATA